MKKYFEGWYLKHQNEDDMIAFIPGYHIDETGQESAFIQIISKEGAHNVTYPIEELKCSKSGNKMKLGDSIFSTKGVKINIKDEKQNLNIKGSIKYGPLTKPKYDIMGPFALVPFMECRHSIISMQHHLKGHLKVNGKWMDFTNGKGYIEGDRGCSFPDKYLWLQSNAFENENCSIMVSIANIPFMKTKFLGCISLIQHHGKQYRLATYLGAKVIHYGEDGLWIKQGNYELKVDVMSESGHILSGPVKGNMSREINEVPECQGRFRLFYKNKIIFDLTSDRVSYEYN